MRRKRKGETEREETRGGPEGSWSRSGNPWSQESPEVPRRRVGPDARDESSNVRESPKWISKRIHSQEGGLDSRYLSYWISWRKEHTRSLLYGVRGARSYTEKPVGGRGIGDEGH